jgi:hypothetical protein
VKHQIQNAVEQQSNKDTKVKSRNAEIRKLKAEMLSSRKPEKFLFSAFSISDLI